MFKVILTLIFTITINAIASYGQLPANDQSVSKPNIVIIYADDLGWGDVGYNASANILTPNIDKLAKSGVIFNQGYVSASVCGPSRAGLLTGMYQQKFGLGENPSATGWPNSAISKGSGIPDEQPIAPEILRGAGYQTAMVGKWHLGMKHEKRPNQKGFNYFYGFLNGAHSYFESEVHFDSKKAKWPLFENNDIVASEGYLTEVFTEKAVKYINSHSQNPFFLYVAYNAVHHPWEVPEKYIDRLSDISLKNRRKFAAMVLAMDDGIGEILNALKTNGIEDNTMVVFISDNGSPRGQAKSKNPKDYMSSTNGLRGYKGDTYEGGIRVPFVIKWPNVFPAAKVYTHPVINLDILPTITSHLKIKQPKLQDGVDLKPFVTGEKNGAPHEIMYWRRDEDYAIRKGDWKLCFNNKGADVKGMPELFYLANDPKEEVNLITQFPELAKELQNSFDHWDSKLPDSQWWGRPDNRK